MGIFSSSRYQEVVIHDLRTPLNVIMLALRMIDELVDTSSLEIAEDLRLIKANAMEQERMLVSLVDYSRLPEDRTKLVIERFDPRRMVADVLEEHSSRQSTVPIELDMSNGPAEAELDHLRARMAVQKAVLSAGIAAGEAPIRVKISGGPDRLVIAVSTDIPPKSSVQTHSLSSSDFERVLGSAAERRGLELTIVGRISELFGGSARLEATPNQGTTVIMDWPARLER